jgi:hypothetical protein
LVGALLWSTSRSSSKMGQIGQPLRVLVIRAVLGQIDGQTSHPRAMGHCETALLATGTLGIFSPIFLHVKHLLRYLALPALGSLLTVCIS